VTSDVKAVERGSETRKRFVFWICGALVLFAIAAEIFGRRFEPVRHWSGMMARVMLLLTSIVWVPLIVYSAFVAWRAPARRGQQARRIGYCFIAVFTLYGTFTCQQSVPAKFASELIERVKAYKSVHARCPFRLADMGIEEETENGQSRGINGIAYWDGDVFYPGPFPFSMNMWKCDTGRWEYSMD
jgi:hypothetical protein